MKSENEAIEYLEKFLSLIETTCEKDLKDSIDMAISALKIERYFNTKNMNLPNEISDNDFLTIVTNWAEYIENSGWCGGLEHITLLELIKAMEKQIPKQVYDEVHCPVCGSCNVDDDGLKSDYCLACGQKLDFGGNDDEKLLESNATSNNNP